MTVPSADYKRDDDGTSHNAIGFFCKYSILIGTLPSVCGRLKPLAFNNPSNIEIGPSELAAAAPLMHMPVFSVQSSVLLVLSIRQNKKTTQRMETMALPTHGIPITLWMSLQ